MTTRQRSLEALIDGINEDKSFCEANNLAKLYIADGPGSTLIVGETTLGYAFNAIIMDHDDGVLCKVAGPQPRITRTRGITADGARKGRAFKVSFPSPEGERLVRWAIETKGQFIKVTSVTCSVSDPI